MINKPLDTHHQILLTLKSIESSSTSPTTIIDIALSSSSDDRKQKLRILFVYNHYTYGPNLLQKFLELPIE